MQTPSAAGYGFGAFFTSFPIDSMIKSWVETGIFPPSDCNKACSRGKRKKRKKRMTPAATKTMNTG